MKFKEMKDTNPTLERWSIKISQYDFEIFHREGKLHENVDCLSRDPVDMRMYRAGTTRDRLFIPKNCVKKVLAEAHNHHHFDFKKTQKYIANRASCAAHETPQQESRKESSR